MQVHELRTPLRIVCTESLARRFGSKYVPSPDGCWDWTGALTKTGYGRIGAGSRGQGTLQAHRVSYALHKGPIPEGLQLDHLCRNRACVNPDHLEAVTQRENTLRGQGPSATCARKTHCQNGHEFTPENTYVRKNNSRDCRTCHRETERLRRATK